MQATQSTSRRPAIPIVGLTVICSLVAVWGVFSSGLVGHDMQYVPMLLSGLLLGFISIFEIRVGLAILLLAIGLSPEFKLYGIDNFRYEDLIFPILCFVWGTRHILSKRSLQRTDLKMPILIILFISLISSLNNHIYGALDARTAILKFGKSVEYYIIFVIVLNSLTNKRDLKAFVYLMILTSALVGVYGIMQFGLRSDGAGFRVSGPTGETANILGGYYVFHLCLGMGLLARAKRSTRMWLILYLGVMIFPFVQTLSRTSYLALFAGFLFIAFTSRNRALSWVLLVACLAAFMSPTTVFDRFMSIFGIFVGDLPSSFEARIEGWKLFTAYAMHAPLLGRGIGTAKLGAVDSEYMLQLHELGLIGLVAFIWLIANCLRTSYRMQRQRKERTLSGFCLGYYGGALALLVHSIGATTFTTIRTTEPFFFATALLYVYWNLTKNKNDAQSPGSPFSSERFGGTIRDRSWGNPSSPVYGAGAFGTGFQPAVNTGGWNGEVTAETETGSEFGSGLIGRSSESTDPPHDPFGTPGVPPTRPAADTSSDDR